MKSKIILCLTLVAAGVLPGCISAKFKVMPDIRKLAKSHSIVAEVTCIDAKARLYTNYRDQHFRIGAMPLRVRWTATFKVNRILAGKYFEKSFTLVDSRDAKNIY